MAHVYRPASECYRPAMQMQTRRSRMHRTRSGKRIELSARDIEIFRLLERYRYLRSTYIHAFAGGASETRFKERLGDLFHEGYIDRPEQQWQFANCRHTPVVYESGAGGQRALRELGIETGEARTFLGSHAHRQFTHSVLICECLASMELEARVTPGLRFIPWSEMLSRSPQSTQSGAVPFRISVSTGSVIPDGMFGLEYQLEQGRKGYRFFALEVDRGTMPIMRSNDRQTSYLGKLAAYREIIERRAYRTHLGIPNLFVLTVTNGEVRAAEIVRQFAGCGETPLFLFKGFVQAALASPMPALLREPWVRAGQPPLGIGESC